MFWLFHFVCGLCLDVTKKRWGKEYIAPNWRWEPVLGGTQQKLGEAAQAGGVVEHLEGEPR